MKLRGLVRIGIGVLVLAAAAWSALNPEAVSLQDLEARLGSAGPWAPIAFMAAFAVGTVLFVPGSVFGLAGGILFGPLWGTVWNVIGGPLGATLAYLIARHAGGDWVGRKTGGRLKAIVEGAEAEGWRFVALTRLVPVVPFNVLNYALGLTRIRFAPYVLATLVCMVPGAAAYAWLGHAGRAAITGEADAVGYALLGLAALALIALAPRLIQRIRASSTGWITVSELRSRLSEADSGSIVDVRGPDEFVGPLGHIPGARNIPLADLGARINTLPRAEPIVLICKTDKRSAQAAAILRGEGIERVQVLRGGMEAWNGQGNPS
jgi:uncharacterized membrane protein YdjX (TVP38/TMEM64 family)/rhodanese-related sulfurtransferase